MSILLLLAHLASVCAAPDGTGTTSTPPLFDGTRSSWTAWMIAFTGWAAWKISDASMILDGTEVEPTWPLPGGAPTTLAEQALSDALDAAVLNAGNDLAAQDAARAVKLNSVREEYHKRNRKLYGTIVSAMPDWLKTSIHLTQRNDGAGAIAYLALQFESHDANDRAAAVQRLQQRYIDARADISEANTKASPNAFHTMCPVSLFSYFASAASARAREKKASWHPQNAIFNRNTSSDSAPTC